MAYVLYFRVLATSVATNVLLVTFLIPVSGVLMGLLVLDEPVEPRQLAGMALIGLGLAAIDGQLSRRAGWLYSTPMYVEAGETSLVVIDRPIVERVFGVFSAVVGGSTAWLCLRFYQPGGDWGDLTLALLAPFLLIVALAGAWRVLTLPTTICRVDGSRRVVELTLHAPSARRQTSWRFEDLAGIEVARRPGYKTETSWRPHLVLRDGRRIALTQHASADRERVEAIAAAGRRLMTGM